MTPDLAIWVFVVFSILTATAVWSVRAGRELDQTWRDFWVHVDALPTLDERLAKLDRAFWVLAQTPRAQRYALACYNEAARLRATAERAARDDVEVIR